MTELILKISLLNEDLINDSKIDRILCKVKGNMGETIYHVIKEERGYLFLNKNEGGLNGYHKTVKELITSALSRQNTKVFIVK